MSNGLDRLGRPWHGISSKYSSSIAQGWKGRFTLILDTDLAKAGLFDSYFGLNQGGSRAGIEGVEVTELYGFGGASAWEFFW